MIKPPAVILAAVLAAAVLVPANASAAPPTPPTPTPPAATASRVGATVSPALRPPTAADPRVSALTARHPAPQKVAPTQVRLAAGCTPGEFGSRSGSALVRFVKASTVDCVSTLFDVSGGDAYNVFREAKMVTIARALRDTRYPGNNSTSVKQLLGSFHGRHRCQRGDPRRSGDSDR